MPSDFKLLLAVGSGVYEIRIHALGEWLADPLEQRSETAL